VSTATFMQVREAAKHLGVHENTLRRWEKQGLVRAVRLPTGVRRFRVDEVERLRDEIYGKDSEGSRAYHDATVKAASRKVQA
jgi:excisionase family DNA binding protein